MPLRQKLDDVIQCLLSMYEAGNLRCKYVIEHNTELMGKVIDMVAKD